MTYEKAMAELLVFENEDVITTSGNCPSIGITCENNAYIGGSGCGGNQGGM